MNKNLGFDDVCREKQVFVAYNNDHPSFWIRRSTGNMIKYPVKPVVRYFSMAREWEIQLAFFKSNNILKPHWIYCNYNWGTLNDTTGQWSGAVGLLQRDEADYAICCFSGTYPRSKVVAFSPGIDLNPLHWLTRYPQELTPMWNLLGLFTKG